MVVRLEGKVNGQHIVFMKYEGSTWKSVFPIHENYDAVIELGAYDDAGNFCFKTCYLLTFDPNSLYMRLVPVNYWLELVLEETMLLCDGPNDYEVRSMPDNVYLEQYMNGEELRMSG